MDIVSLGELHCPVKLDHSLIIKFALVSDQDDSYVFACILLDLIQPYRQGFERLVPCHVVAQEHTVRVSVEHTGHCPESFLTSLQLEKVSFEMPNLLTVSQIWSLMVLPSTSIVLILKSTPIVGIKFSLNTSSYGKQTVRENGTPRAIGKAMGTYSESEEKRGLSDTGVTDEQHLEQVVAEIITLDRSLVLTIQLV